MGEIATTAMRAKVTAIENAMRQIDGHVTELPLVHHFAKGLYAREMHIPAGMTLTGKIHKHEQINILSKGDISVLTEDGVKRVQAPFTVVSPAGTKRVAFAHTDCVWTTILPTDEKNVDRIEDEFIAQNEAEYLAFCAPMEQIECLG